MFNQEWAKIITGVEEGGFGWISYNYLKNVIGPKKKTDLTESYAVIEMGGASAQVTTKAPKLVDEEQLPPDYRFSFTIGNERHTLYSHSYLGYGGEQAREQLNKQLKANMDSGTIKDPCLNEGYTRAATDPRKSVFDGVDGVKVVGASDKNTCLKALKFLFETKDESRCDPNLQPYSFDCIHQPAFMKKVENILAFENFYWMARCSLFHLFV